MYVGLAVHIITDRRHRSPIGTIESEVPDYRKDAGLGTGARKNNGFQIILFDYRTVLIGVSVQGAETPILSVLEGGQYYKWCLEFRANQNAEMLRGLLYPGLPGGRVNRVENNR